MEKGKINPAKVQSFFLRSAVILSAEITIFALVSIIIYILAKGIPNLSTDLFSFSYNSENVSLFPALVNTVTMTLTALLFAVVPGVFSAVYLVEYAKKGNKLITLVGITTETLSGIPSIVYGLFGYLLFVVTLKWGYCMIAGALTLAIMILPLVMRTTQEALASVPDSYREGSFGLGAGKLRTVFKIVLPAAVPGILSGIILSVGRIVGETAALIFTAGTVAQISDSFMDSGRTLAIHLYALWNEGLEADKSYATAVVLLVTVLLINALSSLIAGKISTSTEERIK